ncbi:alpha/beta-type small acid-soluble spore protein [Alicyclobacillus shizuokensis]|uniref:alpha/beta-type small acid-soluble spore protein n=1 Tax=Alicyclobacillus shizuokensis TaxID=392014 RepID=UPI00082D27B3|nr:alpha/beta-type small acid-soluble spore protein [Alicyclobacillus shizuokensis]MCL6626666.1 alpha/beta-type small acid-soluble spore protein [Alicyclobacillus shizuokensis]
MALGQKRNTPVVPGAIKALEQFKYEVASELGITPPQDGYWGTMTTRDTGAIGGNMTRKLVALAEQQLAGRSGGNF